MADRKAQSLLRCAIAIAIYNCNKQTNGKILSDRWRVTLWWASAIILYMSNKLNLSPCPAAAATDLRTLVQAHNSTDCNGKNSGLSECQRVGRSVQYSLCMHRRAFDLDRILATMLTDGGRIGGQWSASASMFRQQSINVRAGASLSAIWLTLINDQSLENPMGSKFSI